MQAVVFSIKRLIINFRLIINKDSDIIILLNGQLTQLVEYLRHMEGVRGSSPLLPTSYDGYAY